MATRRPQIRQRSYGPRSLPKLARNSARWQLTARETSATPSRDGFQDRANSSGDNVFSAIVGGTMSKARGELLGSDEADGDCRHGRRE